MQRICTMRVLNAHTEYLNSTQDDKGLQAAFFKSKVWPVGSTIKIGFLDKPSANQPRTTEASMKKVGRMDTMDPLQKKLEKSDLIEAVKTVVKERIAPLVNLNLVFVEDIGGNDAHDADVRISFADENASWSMVGTDSQHPETKKGGGKSTASMNLGWFDVGTYIHEFGHMLGMVHEHQNPRGVQIKWDIPKLVTYMENTQGWDKAEVEKNVVDKYKIEQINGSDFDPLSIMLYFFPPDLTTDNEGSKQNFRLSGIDTEWISKTYPVGKTTPNDFYKSNYGETLNDSIAQSNSLRKKMDPSNGDMLLYIVIGILVLILLSFGIGVVWYISKRKK